MRERKKAFRLVIERQRRPGGPEAAAVSDPLGLTTSLDASDRFRRDTYLGGIFHLGKISFREIAARDSLHVVIDGGRVSAHVDEISPLHRNPGSRSQYSFAQILAHNVTAMVADTSRRLRGRHRLQRCNLDCEVVWVEDDPAAAAVLELESETLLADCAPAECAPAGCAAADSPVPADRQPATEGPERVPFGMIDEAVHLLDTEAAPWSIEVEARFDGALDESRLRRAISQALALHPMARARKVPSRRTLHRDHWMIPKTVDLDPLRVVDCPRDADLDSTRHELQSLAVPLAESPPLRVRLARHPAGDSLMFNVNHAAMDGFAALRVLRSVARAYAGEPDPVPGIDPLEARERLVSLGRAGLPIRIRRLLALAEKLRDLVAPPARLAADGQSGEAGYGFHHVALSEAQTQALAGLRHKGTVNDVLLAALNLAIAGWNGEHGAACRRVGVLVPSNLRPPSWREEMVGNFSLPARISTTCRQRRTPDAALAAIRAQTRRKKGSGLGTALIELLNRSPLLPLWFKEALVALMPLTGNRLVDTAMLSNLGQLTEPLSFGPEAGEAVELWFSPPARMPLGLAIGAVTVAGRLRLSFRYRHRLFGADAARRFSDRYLEELDRLVRL